MTKKDYIILTRVIKAEAMGWQAGSPQAQAVSQLAYTLTKTLKLDNARFDSERFINACKPE